MNLLLELSSSHFKQFHHDFHLGTTALMVFCPPPPTFKNTSAMLVHEKRKC